MAALSGVMGRFDVRLPLSAEQLQALVTGLPWQRLGQAGRDHGAVILHQPRTACHS